MLTENIKMAFSSLLANKMRTFLTMLGIIIGITSVIAIMTVGGAMTEQVRESMSSFGVENIDVSMYPDYQNPEDAVEYAAGQEPYFTQDMMNSLVRQYPDKIAAIAVSSYLGGGKVLPDDSRPDVYANIDVNGVNAGYFTSNHITLAAGSFFDETAYADGAYQAVVSDKFVNSLYGGDAKKALGKQFDIAVSDELTCTYTIVGVYRFDASMTDMGGGVAEKDISTSAYVPYKNARTLSGDTSPLQYFTLTAVSGTDTITFADDVKNALTERLPEKSGYTVSTYSMQAMVKESMKTMKNLTLAISLIAGIALLVGGIGVMNIMTVSITERTREIGTRKALGAPNSAIRGQFITEAVIMCLIGGLFGMIDGIVIGRIACHFMGYKAVIQPMSVLVSVGFSTGIGLFFGYYPADRAARMDPIEALRYE
jgi:putative ABC transport system permease protein